MRVPLTPPTAATSAVRPAGGAGSPATPARASSGSADLQSGALQPAMAAMRERPELDEARVSELRDALARGDIGFDASKLAGLISRYHGPRS